MPDLTDLYYAELAQGIDAVAKIYKYSVTLAVSDENPEAEKAALNTLIDKHVDGMIYMGNKTSGEMLKLLEDSPFPVVFAGSVDRSQNKKITESLAISWIDPKIAAITIKPINNIKPGKIIFVGE